MEGVVTSKHYRMNLSSVMENSQQVIDRDLEYICNSLEVEFTHLSGSGLLITGGAGFLGYYLIQSILHWNESMDEAKQIRVLVFDNYIRGVPVWLSKLETDKNLSLVKYDVTNRFRNGIGDFEYIIHAASIASPTYYRKHPIETMDANVNGLRSLLEYCISQKQKKSNVKGFLFFSSSEVYGDPSDENIPTPEIYRGNVSCTGPRSCYDESKRFGETLCVNFAKHYDLPIRIARPFNNYGPGLKITDGRVLPDFVRNVLTGKDIVIFSDGSPTRTFCYVADAIVGYYKILVRGRNGEAYNIGVEQPEISIANLAERVAALAKQLFGYQGQVLRKVNHEHDYLIDNPKRRCPMIHKARTELSFNPGTSLDDGLRRSLIWYGDNRETGDAS